MKPSANEGDDAQQKKDDLERLGKQQERVRDALKAVREKRPEEAVAKLQEQIANRTDRLREMADELLQLPTEDPENQQAIREASEKLNLIVLDTSPFPTVSDCDQQKVVLRHADSNATFDPQTTDELQRACHRLGISFCYKDAYIEKLNQTREKQSSLGRTELGRLIAATSRRVSGTTLQLPTSSYHTQMETAALMSVDAMLHVLCDQYAQ